MLTKAKRLMIILGLISAPLILNFSSQAAATPVYTVPSTITANCSTPVSDAIMSFIATVPDNSIIQFPPNGCYLEDYQISVDVRTGLTIDGQGSTFKETPTPPTADDLNFPSSSRGYCRTNWRMSADTNIVVKNMTVYGNNTGNWDGARPSDASGGQCAHGFSFDSVQGGQLLNTQAYNVLSDPVSVEPDTRSHGGISYCDVQPSRNILIDGMTASNAGRTVGITDGDGITIQNSTFNDMYDASLDIEGDVSCEYGINIHILNNHFGRAHFSTITTYNNIVQQNHEGNLEIRGNTKTVAPPTCYPAVEVITSINNANTEYVDNVTIDGNNLQTLGQGIELTNVSNSHVENNVLNKNYGSGCANSNLPEYPYFYGVVLHGSNTVNVYGNQLVNGPNGGFDGELFYDSTSTNITQNPTTTTTTTVAPTTTTTTVPVTTTTIPPTTTTIPATTTTTSTVPVTTTTVPATTTTVASGIPTNLHIVSSTGGSTTNVALAWTGVPNTKYYNIYDSHTSGGPYTRVTVSTTPSVTVYGLSNNSTYYFVVSALVGNVNSHVSNQVMCVTKSTGGC